MRVNLKSIDKISLRFWIKENRFGIFGINFFTAEPVFGSEEHFEMMREIDFALEQVINGH